LYEMNVKLEEQVRLKDEEIERIREENRNWES
jgi:hypothetical protein